MSINVNNNNNNNVYNNNTKAQKNHHHHHHQQPNSNHQNQYQNNPQQQQRKRNNQYHQHQNTFKTLLWNCNRFVNKETLFNQIVKKEKPDVIALVELKCNYAEARHYLSMLNYSGNTDGDYEILFTVRENNPELGGGTALLSKKGLEKNDLNLDNFNEEVSGKILKLNGNPCAIFAWYNPPSKELSNQFLEYVDSKYKNYLILGDLNAHLEPYSKRESVDKNGEILAEFVESSNCTILNNSDDFTSFWSSGDKDAHSIIDLIIGSELFAQNLREYRTMRYSDLDAYQNLHFHIPVVATFNLAKNEKTIRRSNNESYDYAKADWPKYKTIQDASIEELLKIDDPLTLKQGVEDLIVKSANEAIPLISKSDRVENLPGYIVTIIKIKNYWRRRFYRFKSTTNKENYYCLKDLVNLEIYKFKNKKLSNFVRALGPHPLTTKPLWKRIKRMHNQEQSRDIPTLAKDGVEYTTDEEKCKIFADRMANTFKESPDAGQKFDEQNFIKVNEYVNAKKYEQEYTSREKEIKFIKTKDVKKAISRLNSKMSLDHNKISNKLLKRVSPSLYIVLAKLFNMFLTSDYLPQDWLNSTIIMIGKKTDDKSNPKNWRPISITSCLMRLFERIMLKRLTKFLDENNIIIDSQSGFRKKRATIDNILYITQKAYECFNRGWCQLSIFFDVEAAFDKVWHAGLIYKLAKAKIPYTLLKFIINFISGRKARVKVGNCFSNFFDCMCGVPQGACLSPTLYSFYGNDAPNRNIKNKEQTLLFADDSEYNLLFKKLNNSTREKAQKYVSELENWCKLWRATLAPKKCNYIVFSRNNKHYQFDLKLNNDSIPKCKSIKYLGITLDEKLNFQEHITNLRVECRDRVSALKIISHKSWRLTKDTLKKVYHSIVRSKIEYSFAIGDCLQAGALTRLNVIQNNALRAIFKKKKEFGNEPLRLLAEELKLEDRMRDLKKRYLAKCINFDNPIITNLIEEYNSYANGRSIKTKTPLCGILTTLNQLSTPPISSNNSPSRQTQSNRLAYNHIRAGSQIIETDFYSSFNLGH